MSIFRKSKKEKKEPVCACQCNGSNSEKSKFQESGNSCYNNLQDNIYSIKVLGTGCASCHQQYENTKKAVKNMGLNIKVEYITDMRKIMKYGVMSMPAIVVNKKVVSIGKVLKAAEIEKLFHKLAL